MKSGRRKRLPLAACVLLAAVLGGCGPKSDDVGSGSNSDWTLNALLKKLSGRSPGQNVAMAFDPNVADRRREGIVALSKKDWGLKEPYLKGYAAILRTDEDPLVRVAAVRALGRAGDPNYVGDVSRSLFDRVTFVRQDGAAALDSLIGDVAVEPLRNRAAGDADQDVRSNCARALRHYRRDDVVQTLAKCLSDKAFSVRHEAHASLVALAGRDLGHDPQVWGNLALKGLGPVKPPEDRKSWWDRLWQGFKKPGREPTSQPG